MSDTKKHSMQVLNLALVIADGACRADVECYALGDDQRPMRYDLTRADDQGRLSPEEQLEAVAIAQRAAKYIRLRGDAFPWVMHTDPVYDGIVWFEDKPAVQA